MECVNEENHLWNVSQDAAAGAQVSIFAAGRNSHRWCGSRKGWTIICLYYCKSAQGYLLIALLKLKKDLIMLCMQGAT